MDRYFVGIEERWNS